MIELFSLSVYQNIRDIKWSHKEMFKIAIFPKFLTGITEAKCMLPLCSVRRQEQQQYPLLPLPLLTATYATATATAKEGERNLTMRK
jgi:hypothetical protein